MHENLQRAWQLYELRRYALALEEAYKFLGHNQESANAYCLIALIQGKEKRKTKAIEAAREAVRLSPDWCYPHYVLALVQYWSKAYYEAKKSLANALRIDPTDPDYYELLAWIHYEQGHFKSSLEAAEVGLTHDAEHARCHYRRGAALYELNRKQEAEVEFQITLKLNPEHAPSQGFMGHFAVQRGKFADALPLLRHALRDDPQWHFAQKAWKEALRGKYPFYGAVARTKQILFKKHGLPFFSLIYLFNVGLLAFLAYQRKGSLSRDDLVGLVGCLVLTALVYTCVFWGLNLYLALMSRFLLVYDSELRRSHDWKKTLQGWKQILGEFWFYIMYAIIFAVLIIVVSSRRAMQ